MRRYRVDAERDLYGLRYWVRRLSWFTDADRDGCIVDITAGGDPVAEVACATSRLAYSVECIATYVGIIREYGYPDGWGRT